MYIQLFTGFLAALSNVPLHVHGLPAVGSRGNSNGPIGAVSMATTSIGRGVTVVSATTFAPQTTVSSSSFSSSSTSYGYVGTPQNTTGDLTCYQGQYISVQNFTLALQYGCQQIGTKALAKGDRAWQTITTFTPPDSSGPGSDPSSPGGSSASPNSTFTLTFAPQDPNKGQKAKIDMYLENVGEDGEQGSVVVSPEICMTVATVIMAQCGNGDGNTGGGILTDGPFQMYVDGGIP